MDNNDNYENEFSYGYCAKLINQKDIDGEVLMIKSIEQCNNDELMVEFYVRKYTNHPAYTNGNIVIDQIKFPKYELDSLIRDKKIDSLLEN